MSFLKKVKKLGRFADVSAKGSGIRQTGVKLDRTVGGAEGWSKITAGAAKLASNVPVVGSALAVSFSTVSGVTAGKAAKEKAAKAAAAKAAADKVMRAPSVGARTLRFLFPRP